MFVVGFAVLATQPWHPLLNPDDKGMLAPTTIFNTACSFLTNTNLQHYSGEVHLSYFSQLFVICWKQFVTPGDRAGGAAGRHPRAARRHAHGQLLPRPVARRRLRRAAAEPDRRRAADRRRRADDARGATRRSTTLEGGEQTIARGPVAAVVAIKQLGTNGGGFFGANSAHPFENPTAWTNVLECVCIILIPMALRGHVRPDAQQHAARGRHLRRHAGAARRHSSAGAIYHDTLQPNPGADRATPERRQSTRRRARHDEGRLPALAGAAGRSGRLGNLEGKELRFGPSAGPTWAAITTVHLNGSVNCMHDSLNPLAGLTPLTGMWLNCVFGGVGVGLINMLVYLIVAVFLAGLMVGRTPEYLGKKVEAREMKLAMLALLIHPLMILAPTGLFAAAGLGRPARRTTPAPHGFSEILYEFTSASREQRLRASRGWATPTASTTRRRTRPRRRRTPPHWDIATGLVMLLGRFIPIIAPIALAGEPGGEEADAVHRRHAADRHGHVRLRPARHDPAGRGAAVPAGRGARAGRRAPRADPVRRVTP